MGVTCHAPTPASAVTGGLRLAVLRPGSTRPEAGYAYPNAWVHVAITWIWLRYFADLLQRQGGRVDPMPQGDFATSSHVRDWLPDLLVVVGRSTDPILAHH